MPLPAFTDRTHYLTDLRTRKAYSEGAEANRAGAARTTDPHDGTADTAASAAWLQGWDDADAPVGAQTDYDMSGICNSPVSGKPAPELDAIVAT